MRLGARALRILGRLFPPNGSAYMEAEAQTAHEAGKACGTMGRYLGEFDSTHIDVLDFGCGWGGETLWLAERTRSVVGVDIDSVNIDQSNRALARTALTNCRFVRSEDGTIPLPANSVDAVFSTNTFEHVQDLDLAFQELFRVLRPGGKLVSSWGPLFYSPQGYHLYWACQVPYAHLVFGLQSILELRNAITKTPLTASNWGDLGLNGKRFNEYRRAASGAGFEMARFEAIPVRGLHWLARTPKLGDLFVFGVDCAILKRKPAGFSL